MNLAKRLGLVVLTAVVASLVSRLLLVLWPPKEEEEKDK